MKNYRAGATSVCRSLFTKRSALGAMRSALPVLPVPGELALSLSKGPGEPAEGCALPQR